MKCGIVTVYNSENCGSFLQAYAMCRTLEGLGYQAVLVRNNLSGHSSTLKVFLNKEIKTLLRGNFKGAVRLLKQRGLFRSACRLFDIVDASNTCDCYFLGSDVIWDLTVPFFNRHRNFFWGTKFESSRVCSYAASLGFADQKDIEKDSFASEALSKMSYVSVRDNKTLNLLRAVCDKEIRLVCDPTYLVERAEFDKIAKTVELDKFIFIYNYGRMSDSDKEQIQALAKKEGLKTVTFGNGNPWCDVCYAYDPLLFLSLYDKAEYIVTNTFHGTVFSTIYEKRFVVINNDKPKILDVLRMCGMSDKMTQSSEDIGEILHSEFNYEVTRQNILKERENGLSYLKEALGGCENIG